MTIIDTRPKISKTDFDLRVFLDTNVIIDYFSKRKETVDFFNLFKGITSNFNLTLITSDYVLWETCGFIKRDLYIKKMLSDPTLNWTFKQACSRVINFEDIEQEEMNRIGDKIDRMINEVSSFIEVKNLMAEETPGFSAIFIKLLKYSRFQYKDIMVFILKTRIFQ
jgi:predicted nucleic acid-binding protein